MKSKVYMAVTDDDYELPLFQGTIEEISKEFGTEISSMYAKITRHASLTYRTCGVRFIKVELDEDEDDDVISCYC